MDYGSILGRAWRITWRHQAMWAFGLMAVWTFPGVIANSLFLGARGGIAGLFSTLSVGAIMWAGLLWALITSLVITVIHAFGRTALVHQVNQSEDGIEPSVRSGWAGGVRHFLRVLVITFLMTLPVLMVTFGAVAIAFVSGFQGYSQYGQPDALPDIDRLNELCGCFGPAICLSLLLGITLSTLQLLATRVCVLHDEGIWQSIVTAWSFFRTNLGSILMFWGIWLLIGIGMTILMLIPACLIFGLIGGLALSDPRVLIMSDMLLGSVWMGLVSWVISTALTSLWWTFYSTAWTLFYRDLTVPAQPAETMPALDQGVI